MTHLAAALATALAATPTVASAPLALTWSAPEVCPARARFEAELLARTDKVHLAAEGEAPAVWLDVRIVAAKGRFSGTSKLRVGTSGLTVRELKSSRCESLVGALSLATALLLDPEGARTGAIELPPADAGVPAPGPVTPSVDAGAPVFDAGAPLAAVAPVLVPDAGPVTTFAPQTVDAGSPPPAPAPEAWLTVALGGGLSGAPSGTLEPLAALAVTARLGPVELDLVPAFLPGRTIAAGLESATTRTYGATLAASGRLRLFDALSLGLGVEAGALTGPVSSATVESPSAATARLLTLGPVGTLRLGLGGWRLSVQAGAAANLRQEHYVIAGFGEVYRAPAWFGFARALIGHTLP